MVLFSNAKIGKKPKKNFIEMVQPEDFGFLFCRAQIFSQKSKCYEQRFDESWNEYFEGDLLSQTIKRDLSSQQTRL